jgi:AraC family transcriptional regulator
MTANRYTLPYGKFFGTHEISREIPGFSLGLMTPVLQPEDVPLHSHEPASFVLILGGTYLSSAANAGSECGAATLIYNPPLTTHRDRFKRLGGRFFTISVSREGFRSVLDWAALPVTAVTFTSREIVGSAQRLARECGQWEPSSPLLAEAICLELLGLIADPAAPQPGAAPMWLKSAKELLHDRCAEPLRIAGAAQSIGVHPVHFTRSFRHFLRCTPGEYLMRCRLEKALSLLQNANVSLVEAALQTGFFDQSHFTRTFKRHYGVTPRAYWKMLHAKKFQDFVSR